MNLPPHLLLDFALQRHAENLERAERARLVRPERPKRRLRLGSYVATYLAGTAKPVAPSSERAAS